MSDVIDFVKQDNKLYKPGTDPVIIDVPKLKFLMIDGKGAPDPEVGSEEDVLEFQAAVCALYGITYGIKMSPKKNIGLKGYHNFKVPPLEALWWMSDDSEFDVTKADKWRWTMLMRMPDFVTKEIVATFADELVKKKKSETFMNVGLQDYKEGTSVQLLHIGPYSEEGSTIEKMHEFAIEQGYSLNGKHHEIYFGDPRRSAPEKLKTVLRQPIRKVKG